MGSLNAASIGRQPTHRELLAIKLAVRSAGSINAAAKALGTSPTTLDKIGSGGIAKDEVIVRLAKAAESQLLRKP